ncbi:DEAD/DEAH box helicase family protein [Weeksellaceae bacterium TAE3-ERU29]|nr:DEAD/DEAH box helicase family protein [Weeksellaceae bacterium TAE3-ERU29]
MSNFSVFPSDWSFLNAPAIKAEKYVYDDPTVCALYCRQTLEAWIEWIYENDASLSLPYDTKIHSLMTEPDFINIIEPTVLTHMHTVRKLGNKGVHGKGKTPIKIEEAEHIIELCYGIVGYLINLYDEEYQVFPLFDIDKVPLASKIRENIAQAKIKELTEELNQTKELHKESLEKQKQAEQNRLNHIEKVEIPKDPNEALTRKIYIDAYLEEAGWDLSDPKMTEYKVDSMPNKSNTGYVDYVLWGKDGKPLAVIEAKKSTEDISVGRYQAELYAKALEEKFGQLPLVFLTNGYEIYLYDWEVPIRKLYGFYTQDELQRVIDRRTTRLPINEIPINEEITDRYYQKQAIRAVGERFANQYRGALLVMATGTGKTRTSASLIDVLAKSNYIKNVLFLADRTALVTQAKNNLNKYLPDFPSVSLLEEKEKSTSRLVFSTYQTLINLIDDAKSEDGRFYGVGHFDLIIFDEIHRSVYNKYKAIFDYFDGYKIGLTATPRQEQIDRNTYELFGLTHGNPTYNYDLSQAVKDGYLVDYKSYSVSTKFRREGIKYKDLSDEEKLEYEEKFGDPNTGEIPDEIDASALDKWIYNTGTIDVILEELMNKGIKVENGATLGKTIIFTRKRDHAEFIRKRFNANYPQYKDQFLKVIDYKTKYSDSILEDFKTKDKNPVIACSVDMLDTGIDVPEIVNLVFLKPVKSPIKFWQMIGRGTRLCPDLFGNNQHKREFLILDFCENFEYFSENQQQQDSQRQLSLNEKLFLIRLKLAQVLQHNEDENLQTFGQELLDDLHTQVKMLYHEGKESFVVRRHLQSVEKFAQKENWEDLKDTDIKTLNSEIAPLIYDKDTDAKAKMFDLLMYDLLLNLVQGDKRQVPLMERVMKTGKQLLKKQTIPMVKDKSVLLKNISQADYWSEIQPLMVEKIRTEIRDLVKFLENESMEIVETHIEDEIWGVKESPAIYENNSFDKEAYKAKIARYIIENKRNITIDKLRKNIKITEAELKSLEKMLLEQGEVGSEKRFKEVFEEVSLGKFIRSIVGLDIKSAKQAFSSLIDDAQLNSQQIIFLNMIIEHYVQNGYLVPNELIEPPFSNVDSMGIIHLFGEDKAKTIFSIIKDINGNSEAS